MNKPTETAVPSAASGAVAHLTDTDMARIYRRVTGAARFDESAIMLMREVECAVVEKLAAPSAAIAAREFKAVGSMLPGNFRDAPEHWCRECLLYSPDSPHDFPENRVTLYALASRPEPPAVDAGEKETEIVTDALGLEWVHSVLRWAASGYVHTPGHMRSLRGAYRVVDRLVNASRPEAPPASNANEQEIIAKFLERTGQYVTNDASREAAIASKVTPLREALEVARSGLLWYQERYPEAVDGSDDEAMAQINKALEE